MVSVICPIFNEEKYIEKCVTSLLQQDWPYDDWEILFVDGMSNDRTREILKTFSEKYPFISVIDNPMRIVPYAMNEGIKQSKGDIIIRIDAHAEYPRNYISVLVSHLIELNADNVGAPCRTEVLNKNKKTLAIREVLSNRFGVGGSQFRIGIDAVKEVDTVPFGCWKKEVFDKYGLFDVRLIRTQDLELNKRIHRLGGHIFLVPDTYSVYYARETYSAVAKNRFQTGVWTMLAMYYTKEFSSLSIRHFIPLIFTGSLILFPIISIFYFPAILISALSLFSWLVLYTAICILLSVRKKLNFLYLILSFFIIHISQGLGSFIGLIKVLKFKLFKK